MIDTTIDLLNEVTLPPYKILKAGDITCLYETGNLRYIKSGAAEIVRMIYGAVRDENWETVTAVIMDEVIEETENGFIINYTATYVRNEINFLATFYLQGKPDNTIIFSMKGIALNDFKKNRIGLCVLHPLQECCGKEVMITKPDNEKYKAMFPELIAPYQPFKEVREMEWQPADGLTAQLFFTGDTFETEDQRNWSDSSFKTYSTPLHIPFPAMVEKGEAINQQVILKITGGLQAVKEIKYVKENPWGGTPKIGYAKHGIKAVTGKEEIQLFEQYPFHHYRVEIDMNADSYKEVLPTAFKEADLLNTRLELILFFDEDYEQQLDLFQQSIQGHEQQIYSVLLLQHNYKVTPSALMVFGYDRIKQAFPFIKIGYGTDAYFAELNRNRPGDLPYDFVSFSVTPQVHATDERTTIENLECQPDVIQTIRSFTDKPVHVSPVSLYKRKNFDAAAGEKVLMDTDGLPPTDFEIKWLRYCLQQMKDAESICFFTGNR